MPWNGQFLDLLRPPVLPPRGTPLPAFAFSVSMQSFNMSEDRLGLFRLSRVLSFGSYKFYACCLSAALIYLFICAWVHLCACASACVCICVCVCVCWPEYLCWPGLCPTNLPLAGNRCFCIRGNHLGIDWPRSIWFINGMLLWIESRAFVRHCNTQRNNTSNSNNNTNNNSKSKMQQKAKQSPDSGNQSNSCNGSNIETLTCSNFQHVKRLKFR